MTRRRRRKIVGMIFFEGIKASLESEPIIGTDMSTLSQQQKEKRLKRVLHSNLYTNRYITLTRQEVLTLRERKVITKTIGEFDSIGYCLDTPELDSGVLTGTVNRVIISPNETSSKEGFRLAIVGKKEGNETYTIGILDIINPDKLLALVKEGVL